LDIIITIQMTKINSGQSPIVIKFRLQTKTVVFAITTHIPKIISIWQIL